MSHRDKHGKLDFPRGYHIEIGGGYGMPGIGSFQGAARRAGYGQGIKDMARKEYGCSIGFAGRGEMIPNMHSYCEIDRNVVDRWGIPVLKFHFKWTDYEWKQARHMEKTFAEIITTMGGRVTGLSAAQREADGISTPGTIIHEVGTVRMGKDRRDSALNKYCQTHELKNLYVVDGGFFVSNPDKNPTLTINAFAWRAADHSRRRHDGVGIAQSHRRRQQGRARGVQVARCHVQRVRPARSASGRPVRPCR